MTLAQARTELQARGATYLSDARCNSMLNSAKAELEDFWYWNWLETTTTGTAPLTISDLKQVLYVADTTNRSELWYMKAEDIVSQEYYDLAFTGTPEIFYLSSETQLSVWPVQAVSLSVKYLKVSPTLSADGDTPIFPSRYDDIWMDLAMVRVYKDSDDLDRAFALNKDCQQRLGQLIAQYEVKSLSNPRVARIDSGAGDW